MLNIRTRVPPESIFQPVRKALASLDPTLAFVEVHTLSEEVDSSVAAERLTAVLASIFGALAALIAGVGLYAVLAYAMAQRKREIGIRMALGAEGIDIAALTARQTLVMAGAGITVGLGAALAMSPLIRSLLYGVSPQDPQSLIAAAIFVIVVAALATAIPALRAAQVEPAIALRHE